MSGETNGSSGSENISERLDFSLEGLDQGASLLSTATPAATSVADPQTPAYINKQYSTDYVPEKAGFAHLGEPQELVRKLDQVGYQCLPHLAIQVSLLLNTPTAKIRTLLLEGPSGCGKSFMAKSLAKISGAELMCLSCYKDMPLDALIESQSQFAIASAMAGEKIEAEKLMNLGILSRAFLKSQKGPVILLIDELDKPDSAIDTFFLGPIQDARIWLESRGPIDANPENLLIMFTKNFNRKLDEALLRRCHPILMTYLDSTLERKILSPHCDPRLVANLVGVADRMRNSGGSYQFERPPAPEELLTAGLYVSKLLEWGITDFAYVGKCVWPIIAKSEHDRAVMEHMMRYHPDFMDPLVMDSRNAKIDEIHARLGRIVLHEIIADPDASRREAAWTDLDYN
ncbi:MAG: AAA family ATPase [Oligoflexia bacterium]|nr:AAA family ATPase [Oligoflexia bacterium]